jgi:hypothetical protein
MPDQNQIEQMYSSVCRRFGKAQLADTEGNGLHVALYLKENNLPMTEDNLYRAVVACKNILKWKTPPKKSSGDVQDSPDTSRRNYSRKSDDDWGKPTHTFADAAKALDSQKAKKILYDTEHSLIEGHRPSPHSKGQRERAVLTERFKMLVANSRTPITERQAEAIRTEVDNLLRSFE